MSPEITDADRLRLQLQEREEVFSTLVGQAHDSIALFDVESGALVEFNKAAHETLGYGREEFAALGLSGFATDSPETIRANLQRMMQPGGAVIETRHRHRDGRLQDVLLSARPVTMRGRPYLSIIWSDITERKRMEEALRRSNRELRAIGEAIQHIVYAATESEMLQGVCSGMVDTGGYRAVWIGYAQDDGERSVRVMAAAGPEGRDYTNSIKVSWADNQWGRGPTGLAIRMRRAEIARDIHNEPRFAPWRAAAEQHGYASSIALPLMSAEGDHAGGALMVYSERPDAFDEAEVKLLVELTNTLTFGITALRDRAARDEARRAATLSAQRLGHMLESSPAIVYTLKTGNSHLVPKDVSANVTRILGYEISEVLARDFWPSHLHPQDRDAALKASAAVLERRVVEHDYRFLAQPFV